MQEQKHKTSKQAFSLSILIAWDDNKTFIPS